MSYLEWSICLTVFLSLYSEGQNLPRLCEPELRKLKWSCFFLLFREQLTLRDFLQNVSLAAPWQMEPWWDLLEGVWDMKFMGWVVGLHFSHSQHGDSIHWLKLVISHSWDFAEFMRIVTVQGTLYGFTVCLLCRTSCF